MTDTATVTVTETISRYVHAITRMLVNKHVMKPGLAITAGQILNPAGVARIATLAYQSGTDIIHLDFKIEGDIATLRDIVIAAPRDNECFVYTGCRLAQLPGQSTAVLLPQAAARGHFRILPNEIVHKSSKPAKLVAEGMTFAARRLDRLVRDDVRAIGQIDLREVLQTA